MIKELMYKWFGLVSMPCDTCEILRETLAKSESERRELLHRLLDRDKPDSTPLVVQEEPQAIKPQFTPWRVRQQMLEAEDKKKYQLMKDREREINALEKELGVANEGTIPNQPNQGTGT